MTEQEQEELEDSLYDKYSFPISLDEFDKEPFPGRKFGLSIWCNDMFGWALSWAIDFIPEKNGSFEKVTSEFDKWYRKEGKYLLKKFDSVKYPNRDEKSYLEDLDNYFRDNALIGADIQRSINKYCKADVCEIIELKDKDESQKKETEK